MSTTSNTQLNLDKLAELRKQNPFLTHVYIKRDDGVRVDIPIGQAEFTIKNKRTWKLEGPAVRDVTPPPAAAPAAPISLPPRPSQTVPPIVGLDPAAPGGDKTVETIIDTEKKEDGSEILQKQEAGKLQYRALKNFEHNGVQHKYRDILELTDAEAGEIAPDLVKKIEA